MIRNVEVLITRRVEPSLSFAIRTGRAVCRYRSQGNVPFFIKERKQQCRASVSDRKGARAHSLQRHITQHSRLQYVAYTTSLFPRHGDITTTVKGQQNTKDLRWQKHRDGEKATCLHRAAEITTRDVKWLQMRTTRNRGKKGNLANQYRWEIRT